MSIDINALKPEPVMCNACGRSAEDCDEDPTISVDRWNYGRDEHYTVEYECDGVEERGGGDDHFNEPEEDPDCDIDEAKAWGGIDL